MSGAVSGVTLRRLIGGSLWVLLAFIVFSPNSADAHGMTDSSLNGFEAVQIVDSVGADHNTLSNNCHNSGACAPAIHFSASETLALDIRTAGVAFSTDSKNLNGVDPTRDPPVPIALI